MMLFAKGTQLPNKLRVTRELLCQGVSSEPNRVDASRLYTPMARNSLLT